MLAIAHPLPWYEWPLIALAWFIGLIIWAKLR